MLALLNCRLTLPPLTFPLFMLPLLILPADLFPTAGRAPPPPPRAMLACATVSQMPLVTRIVKTTIILRMVPSLLKRSLSSNLLQFETAICRLTGRRDIGSSSKKTLLRARISPNGHKLASLVDFESSLGNDENGP